MRTQRQQVQVSFQEATFVTIAVVAHLKIRQTGTKRKGQPSQTVSGMWDLFGPRIWPGQLNSIPWRLWELRTQRRRIVMAKNMGTVDRVIRFLFAVVVAVLYFTGVIIGTLALVLGILAGVLLLTSILGFCPLYLPLKFSTAGK